MRPPRGTANGGTRSVGPGGPLAWLRCGRKVDGVSSACRILYRRVDRLRLLLAAGWHEAGPGGTAAGYPHRGVVALRGLPDPQHNRSADAFEVGASRPAGVKRRNSSTFARYLG